MSNEIKNLSDEEIEKIVNAIIPINQNDLDNFINLLFNTKKE